ncbi:MAG: twin-arginine translocase TatA/TatE family subunit [Sphingomicrobium sp.]
MFGVDSTEFVIVAVLALIFIGPKDLPKVMRTLGYWIGRVRGMARHFTSGIETMMREAELEEMEKKWREENERIMKLHPPGADYPDPPTRVAGSAVSGDEVASPTIGDGPGDGGPGDQDHLPPEQRELP